MLRLRGRQPPPPPPDLLEDQQRESEGGRRLDSSELFAGCKKGFITSKGPAACSINQIAPSAYVHTPAEGPGPFHLTAPGGWEGIDSP